MELVVGADGIPRCWWGASTDDYIRYHDEEWGRAVTEDHRLFEKICLEGFQSGLSWLTILRKRDNFRKAFAGFDPVAVAGFDDADVHRLLADAGIIRHEGKIRSTINNAREALHLIEERGSLAVYFWSWAEPEVPAPSEIPPVTETSTAMSKDLKKRGWSFVGPTTVYAFMQAMGLVNDHLAGCHVRGDCARERRRALGLHL
jgi:DNA-3-methyladenine glycosylase I